MGCGASQSEKIITKTEYVTKTEYIEKKKAPMKDMVIQTSMEWDNKASLPDNDAVVAVKETATVEAVKPEPKKPQKGTGEFTDISPEDVWCEVSRTLEKVKISDEKLKVKRTGWKTIRIFVSSTFKDFHAERELLVKEVFPDLRAWCEQRRLHLVECDLRWGVPQDSTTELTLKSCLGEIDRCYSDNIMPYFLNMTSQRMGWVPSERDVPSYLAEEYQWIFGLSVTEMEIIHGAYRRDNPNSIFMIRDDDFLDSIPQKERKDFVDEHKMAPRKMKLLKEKIDDRFPDSRVIRYQCSYNKFDKASGRVLLNIQDIFKEKILAFFRDRISWQYPLIEHEENALEKARESHESFMTNRAEMVLGRENVLEQINDYIKGPDTNVPFLILGGPGTGKSSIMARAVRDTISKADTNQLQSVNGHKTWRVFYHFVGAVPGSTDLLKMLQRFLKELELVKDESSMPNDLDGAAIMTCSALNNPATPPTIIFVDALNQFDEDKAALVMTWLPRALAPQVRCVFSLIDNTPQHKNLLAREKGPQEITVLPLNLQIRKEMVVEYLKKFNKQLDLNQMIDLLNKQSSQNPLWLSIACEELRVFGQFRLVSEKIKGLADGLLELLEQVLDRFEQETDKNLLVASLCLLEVSHTGLLEAELLHLLADEEALLPGSKKGKGNNTKYDTKLPAAKWANVYRALRPFLRPFGDSGDGRLDFYHRSLSKAVRRKYLKQKNAESDETVLDENYKWWHTQLINFFRLSENWDRKVEEYPFHVIAMGDFKELRSFLSNWEVIDRLYDREFSSVFLQYWSKCGAHQDLVPFFEEILKNMEKNGKCTDDTKRNRYTQVAHIYVQAGCYDPAMELAEKALEIEKGLGGKKETMAELYSLLCHVWDQKVKQHEFVNRDQIPEERKAIEYGRLSIDLYRELSGKQAKYYLGKQLIKLGFSLASFHDCGGDATISAAEALTLGHEATDEAMKIFSEVNDIGHMADAKMTKAVLIRGDFKQQVQIYEEALKLCLDAYGRYHILTGRIYMNTAIAYEDRRDYKRAYHYFKENYLVNREVYGPDHVKTKRSSGILVETTYIGIAKSMGDESMFRSIVSLV